MLTIGNGTCIPWKLFWSSVSSLRTAKVLQTYQSGIKLWTQKVCLKIQNVMTNTCKETGYAKVQNIKTFTQGRQLWPAKFIPCLHKLTLLCIYDDTDWFTRCQIFNCQTIRHCVMWVGNVTACLGSPDMVCVYLSGRYPNAKGQKPFPRYGYPFPLIAWSQEWWMAEYRLKWTQNEGKAWYSAHCKSFSFTRLRSHWR